MEGAGSSVLLCQGPERIHWEKEVKEGSEMPKPQSAHKEGRNVLPETSLPPPPELNPRPSA